ncbi:MAG: type IV toxin-antitoxin system AbiEi family antitoxin domain-containing protein [Solirubrobacterales bacterium]
MCGVVCGIRTRSGNPDPKAVLQWFATRQGGRAARRQLLAAGVSTNAIGRRVRSGLLLREHPGVYALAHRAPTEWGRELAATLACGPGSVTSHRSAARVHGFLPYPATGVIWVTTTSLRGTGASGVRLTRTRVLDPDEVVFEDWLPLTSPARTLLDVAGLEDAETLEEAVAAAQVRRAVTGEELWAQVLRSRGRRGAGALRTLLERSTPAAETRSVAERLMLRLIRRSGLPEPLVNKPLGGFRPDFYWPEQRVVAEFDSYRFHTDVAAFRRDREKSNELQLRGIVVLRFTWHELTREPRELEARLRRALGA